MDGVFATPVLQEVAINHSAIARNTKYFTCWRCGRHTVGEVLRLYLGNQSAMLCSTRSNGTQPMPLLHSGSKTYERPYELELIGSKTPDEAHIRYLNSRHIDTDWLVDRYDARFTKEHKHTDGGVILPMAYNNMSAMSAGTLRVKPATDI